MEDFSEHLEALKLRLAKDEEFQETFKYFFDHLGENPAFIQVGERAKHPIVKLCLKGVADNLFNEKGVVTQLRLLKVGRRKDAFYHGACLLNDHVTTLFFFEAIDMGMAAVHLSPVTHMINYARFTTMRTAAGKGLHVTRGPGTLQ